MKYETPKMEVLELNFDVRTVTFGSGDPTEIDGSGEW